MNNHLESAMREAIALAEQGRFSVAPNPTVGAVLVNEEGEIVARGWHQARGGDHAEVACLKDAANRGIDPAACTLVVTLEPCNHQGLTPPCTQAVLAAGIKHVVVGLADPNPQAAGGAECLRAAGVRVDVGVLESQCRDLVADFLLWQTQDRPYVILKMAASLDGRIATRTGHSRTISNESSLRKVAELRAGVGRSGGAVLVGGNTFVQDNPLLTARIPGVLRQPLAAVATSRLPGPDSTARLLQERPQECVFFSSAAQAASPNAAGLRAKGSRIYGLDRAPSGNGLNVQELLACLHKEEGCAYVLCEGGARMACSLLEQNLVDEFHLFLAPIIMADEQALPLVMGRSTENLMDALRMRLGQVENLDGDCHMVYRPAGA